MKFDNKLEMSDAQGRFFNAMDGTARPLEQTRSGAILFVDLLNPYKPMYVITLNGTVREVYGYYNLERKNAN